MKNLVNTQTAQNLMRSLANECQTRVRYEFFAHKAKQACYIQIANVFLETSKQERAHAETFLYFLKPDFNENLLSFNVTSPIMLHEKTAPNLEGAVHFENKLWTQTYPQYAQAALKEGFAPISDVFERVAAAEKMHEKKLSILLKHLNNGTIFSRSEPVKWMRNNCGYIHCGKTAQDALIP